MSGDWLACIRLYEAVERLRATLRAAERVVWKSKRGYYKHVLYEPAMQDLDMLERFIDKHCGHVKGGDAG